MVNGYDVCTEAIYKLNKGKITLAMYNEIARSIRDMWIEKREVTTICLDVAEFFRDHGIIVKPEGIGWRMKWR